MYKKIYIAVDVEDDAQRDRVQRIAEDLSSARVFNGNQIENIYPLYRQYENDIRQLFWNVSHNGFNTQTMMTIGKLASKMIRKR